MNRIPTCDNLVKRGVEIISDLCSIGGNEFESVEHLFLKCATAKWVLDQLFNWPKLPLSIDMELEMVNKWGNSLGLSGLKENFYGCYLHILLGDMELAQQ